MSAGNAISWGRFRALALRIVALGCVLFALPAAASAAAPVASDVFAGTNDTTPVVVNFNATDGGNPPVTYAIVTPPTGGTLGAVNQAGPGSVTYTANPTFAGIDSFTYSATNQDPATGTATATVVVRPDTAILTGPSGLTNNTAPSFTFSSPQAGTVFECSVDGAAFTACSSPFTTATLSDGAHTFDVRARAGLGGPVDNSPSSRSITVDATAPVVTLAQAIAQADPTNAAPIAFTISSNEDLNGATVTASDFDVTNGTIAGITGGPSAFTVNVTPTADGAVSIAPSGTFSVSDLAGNAQTAAGGADRSVLYDSTAPAVVLQQAAGQADPTNVAAIQFSFTSNENLNPASVDAGDFTATNGSIDSVTGSGQSFTVNVTGAADGAVTIAPSGTFQVADSLGNTQSSAAGADRSVTYDTTPATVTLDQAVGQPDPTTSTSIQFTLSSNEPLSPASVTAADFDATNATIDSVTGSGASFTINVTATSEATVSLAPSATFSVDDLAGNSQTSATSTDASVLYDTPPDFTLQQAAGQADPTNVAAIAFDFTADEPVNPATVDVSDFDATNGTVSGVTGSGADYVVTVTATADGGVSIAPSGSFSVADLIGNATTTIAGGTDRTVTYDGTNPVTTLSVKPGNPSYDRTPSFEFSADEAVTGFECSLVAAADPSDFQSCTSPLNPAELTPGNYRFEVRSTDIAGNVSSVVTHAWTLLPSSITGSPVQGTYFTRGGDPVTVAVFASDSQAGSFSFSQVAGGTGTLSNFAATPNGGSATYVAADGFAGVDTVTMRVRNDVTQAYRDIDIDVAVRPATRLLSGPGVGGANPNSNTNAPTFTFDAVSGPGNGVVSGVGFACSIDGNPIPSINCATGSWTPATPLADGPHTFAVTASKPALNVDPQTQSVSFSVDTVAPDAPALTGTEGLTNSNDLSFQVTLPEGTSECRLIGPGNPTPAWLDGRDDDCDGTVDFADVPDGEYTFEVRTVDSAGNRSPVSSLSSTVDTTVTVTIDSAPADGNADARPTIEFSSPEDPDVAYSCRLFPASAAPEDQPAFAACDSPVVSPFLDTNERFRFEVKGVDLAGNETVTSVEWDQTNTAPAVPAPDVTVAAGSDVVVALGSTDADSDPLTYSIVTDPVTGGTLGAVNQGTGDVTFSAAGNAAGIYTFDFSVTDQRQGGTVTGTATVRVEPQTVFVTEPPAETNNVTPTWTFESPSGVGTFECNLDGGGWTACDGGSFTPAADLSEGAHTLQVRATSGALADQTPAVSTITVDLTAPDVAIDSTPVALSNVAAPVFEFSSTDATATFECSVDNGDWAVCASGDPITAVTDGLHNFRVRAVDPATNAGTPASYDWEVDLTDPVIELGGQPEGVKNGPSGGKQTNARRPVWHFLRSDLNLDASSVRCYVDSGTPLANCLSPYQPANNLSDGLHTLHIEADDLAGNSAELVTEFRVNTVAPSATFTEVPDTPTSGDVTFSFTSSVDLGPDGSFACRTRLNGGSYDAWSPCSSPLSLTGLSSGTRTLQVKAIDSAGNESTGAQIASFTWAAVGGSPDTAITASTKNGSTAAFAFNSPGNPLATFQCSLDGAAFASCVSPKSYSGLSAAAHEFRVRAVNSVGTIDPTPAVENWTVSAAVAPNTSITSQPPARTSSPDASFSFVSSEAVASFECRLDGGAFAACDSPTTFTGLAAGDHTFEVRSTTANGTDQSPASVTWTVGPPDVNPLPAEIGKPVVKSAKTVKSGKILQVSAVVANNGDESAPAKVCLKASPKLIRGKAQQCRTVTVAGGSSATVRFKVRTRPKKAGRALRMTVTVQYSSSGTAKKEFKGHVSLLK